MRLLSDGEREILRDCEFDVEGLYDGERECHGYDDDTREIDVREITAAMDDYYRELYAESPSPCPLLAGCTADQIDREREWATNDLVRLWERGDVSFEFLCDSQRRLGIGDCE